MNVQEYLSHQYIPFEVIDHAPAHDAPHLASAVHESGHHVAKTVLLRADGDNAFVVAVLPANESIDLQRAGEVLYRDEVKLASEDEVAEQFPDCERGVVPPFGSHYGMKTIIDVALTGEEEIVFEGSTHSQAIKMKYKDFEAVEHPTVVSFCAAKRSAH